MKNARLIITVLFIVTICFASGAAQMTPDYDSVEELLLLLRIDETLARTFEQMRPTFLQYFQQMVAGELTPEQLQIVEKYMGKLLDLMQEEMSWEKLKDDYIRIYMSVYTEEEIQELIKFYQSPVGQKTIEQTPILMEQSMEISQKYLMNTWPKIQALSEEMQAELEASFGK